MVSVAHDQKKAIRDLRNYLAGQAVGATRDEALLEELLSCAFCLRFEHHLIHGADDLDAGYTEAFGAIKSRFSSLFAKSERISLAGDQLATVHKSLSQIDFDDQERDIVGDIYEAFVGDRYRGQEGQFFTPLNAVNALVEMTDPRPGEAVIDPACGAGAFLLQAALRASTCNTGELPMLTGVDKDAYLARLARIHLALQFGKEFPIICADSLAWRDPGLCQLWNPEAEGEFDIVLTNPPFGKNIISLTGNDRDTFALAHKWKTNGSGFVATDTLNRNTPPQVLFLERCLGLLRPDGRMGIVLPESVLSNVSHRHVMQWLLERASPQAVIGMPEALFKTSGKGGTHTKVCLMVLTKNPRSTKSIFMAEVAHCGNNSRGQATDHDEVPTVTERYTNHRAGKKQKPSHLGFIVNAPDLRNLVLAPKYYDPEALAPTMRLKRTHDLLTLGDLIASGQVALSTGDEVGTNAYGTGDIPFVRTSDISSWEVKIDPKHLVSTEVYEKYATKQDVREGDLLMVRDGTYLIGTPAYITAHDTRIVYQSHLYKLRITADDRLNRFLLLAILSSAPVRAQIRSLSFTQDIINSLGNRIREVILPVPKEVRQRRAITESVAQVIHDRVEARELARKATELVVAG